MPRKPKTTEPEVVETKPVEAAPEAPRGSKTAAIKAALKANRDKLPKEIAELMNAEGWDVTAQRISVVKSALKAKKKEESRPSPNSRKPDPWCPRTPCRLVCWSKPRSWRNSAAASRKPRPP